MTISEVNDILERGGYCTNERISCAVYTSLLCGRPLLIEGDPGVGKTALAKAIARGTGLEFIRVQMYEGLTADQVLYDYDYQKQLLTLEAIRPRLEEEYQGLSLQETIHAAVTQMDFYGPEFLLRRPVLRAITAEQPVVLLFDEIDKASEETEYMLYEFLEHNAITIPQYGEIACPQDRRPLVFLTSNNYRELSGALRRRCNYLYIEHKSSEEMVEILRRKAGARENIAVGIARCLSVIQGKQLRQTPSIAEAVELARFLQESPEVTRDLVMNALSILVKNHRDEPAIRQIVSQNGELIWSEES